MSDFSASHAGSDPEHSAGHNAIELALNSLQRTTSNFTVDAENPSNPLLAGMTRDGTDNAARIAALTSWMATQGGGSLRCAGGTYDFGDEITIPFGTPITIIGIPNVTKFRWQTDLGVNKYAVKYGPFTSFVNNTYMALQDITFVGPGNPALTMGAAPANMNGVQLERKCEMVGCNVVGFRSGISLYGNHQRLHRTSSRANYYNVYFQGITGTDVMIGQNYGDTSFVDCDFQGASFASVAVGNNAGIINSVWTACQFGFSPYCFYRESGPTGGAFMSGSSFDSCNYEQVGNAIVYCEDANSTYDVVRRCVFSSGGMSTSFTGPAGQPSEAYNNSYRIQVRNQNYLWRVGTVEDTDFLGGSLLIAYPGTLGHVQAANFRRSRIFGAQQLIDNIGVYARPVFTATTTSSDFTGTTIDVGLARYKIGNPAGTYAARDVLEAVDVSVRKFSGADAAKGLAIEAGADITGLERRLYVYSGRTTAVTSSAITSGSMIRPSTSTFGQVVPALGNPGPILGYAVADATGGTVEIELEVELTDPGDPNVAIVAIQSTLGTNPQGSYADVASRFTAEERAMGGRVFQSSGFTIAVCNGIQVSSLATTAANNVAVIQAAIAALAGTPTVGSHGGGALLTLSDHLYLTNAEIVGAYGVSLLGTGSGTDRGAGSYDSTLAASMGTTIRATTTNQNMLRIGAAASGSRIATNPHGVTVRGITFDGRTVTSTGIRLNDTADFKTDRCAFLSTSKGIDINSTMTGSAGGVVATRIGYCDFFGCTNAVNIPASGTGASDGEMNNCRVLISQGTGVVLGAGGWQILQNHFTTASGGGPHLAITSSPALIVNNYLDTVGNAPHITNTSSQMHLIGNYIKASNGRNGDLVQLTNTGYRAIITGNVINPGTGTTNFVTLPTTPAVSGQDVIISNNSVNITDPTGWIGVVASGGVAVADQDTTNGPYIKGNRTWP